MPHPPRPRISRHLGVVNLQKLSTPKVFHSLYSQYHSAIIPNHTLLRRRRQWHRQTLMPITTLLILSCPRFKATRRHFGAAHEASLPLPFFDTVSVQGLRVRRFSFLPGLLRHALYIFRIHGSSPHELELMVEIARMTLGLFCVVLVLPSWPHLRSAVSGLSFESTRRQESRLPTDSDWLAYALNRFASPLFLSRFPNLLCKGSASDTSKPRIPSSLIFTLSSKTLTYPVRLLTCKRSEWVLLHAEISETLPAQKHPTAQHVCKIPLGEGVLKRGIPGNFLHASQMQPEIHNDESRACQRPGASQSRTLN